MIGLNIGIEIESNSKCRLQKCTSFAFLLFDDEKFPFRYTIKIDHIIPDENIVILWMCFN